MHMTSTPRNPADAQSELLAHAIAAQPNAAELYYKHAETLWRARDLDGYASFYRRGYLLSPSRLSAKTPGERRDRARTLIDRGALYSHVIAALAVAEAQLGNTTAVRHLMDYDRFFHHAAIDPPDGMSTETFNLALASEIKSNLEFYDSPPDRAIRHAWRYDAVENATTPALRALMRLLRRHSSDYVNNLPADPSHPFIAARPAKFEIGGWAVVSNGASYHEAHIHPRAWATGVYYVVQPEISISPDSRRGWLTIGPAAPLGEAESPGWERRNIEPVAGNLVIMPGHFFHETQPMNVDEERICVAFEIRPPELSRTYGE